MYRNLRLAGPSTNPLMTADEYERNRRTESNALHASVERHYPAWTDAHIPRTEKPVRFGWKWHVGGISGDGACWVYLNRSGLETGWRKASQA